MILQIFLLVLGLLLVVYGADFLVDGASAIAKKAGISDFVIGLTIVGFGTSMPELVVSVTGALEGMSAVSIGNVVGSNICNTLLILGLTAVLTPIAITRENVRRDIPLALAATLLLVLYGMRHTLFGIGTEDGITRVGGVVFLLIFAAYLYSSFKNDKGDESVEDKGIGVGRALLLTVGGIAALIIGGQLFVNTATDMAAQLGVSEKFVAITVLALGTSLPELATCVVAAAKKKGALALGNILGSNVFNILLILGTSAAIRPISFQSISLVDMGILVVSALSLLVFCFTGGRNKIDRSEGAVLLVLETAYFVWLCINL